jgi:predicted MFS family arabinose efflux permease
MFKSKKPELFKKENIYIFLLILTVSSTVGFQTWRTLYNNFAVEIAGLNGFQNGVVQSFREIPGFLSLLVVYVLLIIKERRLAAFSVLVMGLGITLTGFYPSFYGLIITTLLLSFGFHYYETLNQSLVLQHFDTKTTPLVFGRLRSMTAATNIMVGIGVFILVGVLTYRTIYLAGGLFVIIAAGFCLFIKPGKPSGAIQKKGLVFRKKYWLFYTLTFLAGARRQVFVAFAVFLLVKNFDYSIKTITILFLINNLINYFLSPLIGRAIVRFGERKMLSLEYASLIFVFLTYAFSQSAIVVGIMYVLDHISYSMSMAIRTYFQKIADPHDIAPSMAVGFTINHISAIVIPALGGWFWLMDYKIPFIAGAVLGFISLIATQFIRIEKDAAS